MNTSESHMYTFKSICSFTYFNIVTFFDQPSFSRSSFSLAQGAQSCCLRFDLSLDQFECIFVSGRQSGRLCYAVQNLELFTTVRLCLLNCLITLNETFLVSMSIDSSKWHVFFVTEMYRPQELKERCMYGLVQRKT